jgi:isopentenyldiphosphate isomerase
MDRVIVVNEKDEQQGTMLRSEAHANGTPHRIVVTYVENGLGQIVIQVRRDGSLDHSSAGHVDPGESYAEAALRELREELGIEGVQLTKIDHATSDEYTANGGITRHVFDIFVCTADFSQIQEDEVTAAYWADPHDVWIDMNRNASKAVYAGGFRASLPRYLTHHDRSTAQTR